jgi:hypothetical protein
LFAVDQGSGSGIEEILDDWNNVVALFSHPSWVEPTHDVILDIEPRPTAETVFVTVPEPSFADLTGLDLETVDRLFSQIGTHLEACRQELQGALAFFGLYPVMTVIMALAVLSEVNRNKRRTAGDDPRRLDCPLFPAMAGLPNGS